jgi:dihydrofolate reductase
MLFMTARHNPYPPPLSTSVCVNPKYFRANLKLGPGGETGPVNDLVRSTTERIGANVMGKRMFEQGEVAWPEEAPFLTPVYVLTHEKREPWARPGGTTFYFINDGPTRALELARQSAGSVILVSRVARM